MHKLSEKFNSSKSKMLLTLAVLATTSGALFNDLNAQTANNGGKAKTEVVDKNDILQVKNFMSDLNKALSKHNIQITLSPEQEKLAINGVGRLDSRGKSEAIKLIVNLITTGKVTTESTIKKDVPVENRDEIIGFVLDAIEQAYDRDNAKLENIMANADLYTNYENSLSEVTNTFKIDRTVETDRLNNSIAQNEQKINQNEQKINQNNKISEEYMLKTYKINPNSEELKILAKETKQVFDKTNYKYSTETAQIFTKLGIK